MKDISLYIHIPFCKQKCFYCDFPSYSSLEYLTFDYIEALCCEIQRNCENYKIKSIFIGGGTPSYLSTEEIKKLLVTISKLSKKENMEFSMECNPGTLTKDKLITMKKGGINRISMGLQAVQNSILKDIGRIHTFDEFKRNYELAREVGFRNINVDLMYGLPNQSLKDWKETLITICNLKPEHISAYSLIIEEGTCFYEKWNRDKLNIPSEDLEREMDCTTKEILKSYGYNQYEISNYAKEGYECLHNKVYWRCEEYLGLGVSGSSFVDGVRFKNIGNIKEYIKKIKLKKDVKEEVERNSDKDNIEEFVFMGLRMIRGISEKEFKDRFGRNIESIYKEAIEKNINMGLLEKNNENIRLTDKGVDLSNSVMSDFIL